MKRTKDAFIIIFLVFLSFFLFQGNVKAANLKATCPYVGFYANKEAPFNISIKVYDDDTITIDLYKDSVWKTANVKKGIIGEVSIIGGNITVYLDGSNQTKQFIEQYNSYGGCPVITSKTESMVPNSVWLLWGDYNDDTYMMFASKSKNPKYEKIVTTTPTDSTSKTTCSQRCSDYSDAWAIQIGANCIRDCEECVGKCSNDSCKTICYNSNYVEKPTGVTQTKTCPYSIKTNAIKNANGLDIQLNMYSDADKELCIRVSGATTYSCDKVESSTIINEDSTYFGVLAKNPNTMEAYLFTISGSDIKNLYKNISHQTGTFTCPSSSDLYIVENPTYSGTSKQFFLTTDAKLGEEKGGVNLLDGSLVDNGEGKDWESELPGPLPNDRNDDIRILPNGEPINCSDFTYEEKDEAGNVIATRNLINEAFNFIKLIGPIVLIIFGTIDFAKATLASDENAIKKAGTNFGKRVLAAILLFLTPLIVSIILDIAYDTGVFGTTVPEICITDELLK